VHFTGVTPGYFAVLRIALHRGQLFQRNISPAGKVALVNGVLARELFGNMEALGRQITFKGDTASIVGVVADTREFSLDVPSPPHVYIPLSNERMPLGLPAYFLKVVVRSQGAPGQLAAPLRTILRRLDPAMPVDKLMPMSDMVGESTAAQRVTTTLVAILAALALVIATAGAYAVISRGAIRRERELAIRIALGARQRDLVSLVIGRAACLLGIGAVLGGGTAVATTKILQHVVVGVSANSVFVIGSVATVLIGVGLVASWQPVKRALRADPAAIIRFE
jgi:ABC-type antimicrobial peptide transport system permease subunit